MFPGFLFFEIVLFEIFQNSILFTTLFLVLGKFSEDFLRAFCVNFIAETSLRILLAGTINREAGQCLEL
jgi:hypothetical protein